MIAPIVLFVYNRPEHTKKTLESISKNIGAEKSDLIVFCDGPKQFSNNENLGKINETRQIVKDQKWPKSLKVIEQHSNMGLKKSIINGVTEVLQLYGRAIVLEDDIETATGFLNYMNSALNILESRKDVMHIGGYCPESVLQWILPEVWSTQFMSCWGWATWQDRWSKAQWDIDILLAKDEMLNSKEFTLNGAIDFKEQLIQNKNEKINTWAIFWFTSISLVKGICIYPNKSLVRNIGIDGSGINYNSNLNIPTHEGILKMNKKLNFKIRKQITKSRRGKFYLMLFYKFKSKNNIEFSKLMILRLKIKLHNFYHKFTT